MNILQYESKIWATADLLRGSGIKESEWPSFMMPFFALVMIESRLIRMFDELKAEIGEEAFKEIQQEDLYDLIKDKGQGYNIFIFEKNQSLSDICKNDKSFDIDFDAYLHGFDGETKDLLGVDAVEGEKFLDIRSVIAKLKAKKVLLGYTKLWAEIDLKPFNNSEITTLEEHIKRKWADISAETAGEQYTPDDVIALISDIVASKIEESDKLLKIYDCTCGGGNMLFGVEDRINKKFKRLTQTYGQDWNDALYALAKIESRFRPDSKIEHGNTLVDDKFDNEEFDVVIANPPYGVSWSGYAKDIQNDKTERFKFLPSISDGQLLFMQHLISKLDANGIGVVVHNGSTLFSGDAGSAESNIRKWMLDNDLVEAVIQLPTDEFFNTGIHTYLWIINKNKPLERTDKIMLINASEQWSELKKIKGHKRREIPERARLDIVKTLSEYKETKNSKIYDKEHFYFNKQAVLLTNVDVNGLTYEAHLPEKEDTKTGEIKKLASQVLTPISLTYDERLLDNFLITKFDASRFNSLYDFFEQDIKPFILGIDYKKNILVVKTYDSLYYYESSLETIIKQDLNTGLKETLGCGKILVKAVYKNKTKKLPERIEIGVELAPDYEKDYEFIGYQKEESKNLGAINAFLEGHISLPYVKLENTVGVSINFNSEFFYPELSSNTNEILNELNNLESEISFLEKSLVDIYSVLKNGLSRSEEMKDTGIAWIGSIPSHWEIKRVKDLFVENKEKSETGEEELLSVSEYTGVTKKSDSIGDSEHLTRAESLIGYKVCAPGDLVINIMLAWKRGLGISNYHGIVSPSYAVYRPKRRVNTKYFHYLFRTDEAINEFKRNSTGIIESRLRLYTDKFFALKVPVPPEDEQEKIASYLDMKNQDILKVIELQNQKIKAYQDLKDFILNNATFGRIKS